MTRFVRIGLGAAVLGALASLPLHAQHSPPGAHQPPADTLRRDGVSSASPHQHGAAPAALTYRELQRTAELLAAARHATTSYQDVRAAEAAGYRPVGPNVPGMGVHYVRASRSPGFDVATPQLISDFARGAV